MTKSLISPFALSVYAVFDLLFDSRFSRGLVKIRLNWFETARNSALIN